MLKFALLALLCAGMVNCMNVPTGIQDAIVQDLEESEAELRSLQEQLIEAARTQGDSEDSPTEVEGSNGRSDEETDEGTDEGMDGRTDEIIKPNDPAKKVAKKVPAKKAVAKKAPKKKAAKKKAPKKKAVPKKGPGAKREDRVESKKTLEEQLNNHFLVEDEDTTNDGDIEGEYKPIDEINENSGLQSMMIEGDMLNTDALQADIKRMQMHAAGFISGDDASTRGKWPNATVPYLIASNMNAKGKAAIDAAMADFHAKSCIKFVKKTTAHKNYINIIQGGGCYSYIGDINRGAQSVSIGFGCEYKGIVIHEFMHALGFYHEQSRRDRDQYITIDFSNIPTNRASNFQKYQAGAAETHGAGYDKQSVMHYGNKAFAINRSKNTITSKSDPNEVLGQRSGFSTIDLIQLNKHYSCESTAASTTKAPETTARPVTNTSTTSAPLGPDLGGKLCGYFADKPAECQNPLVNTWCKATCEALKNVCTAKDSSKYARSCPRWAKAGFCKRQYTKFMNKYCAKSCTCE